MDGMHGWSPGGVKYRAAYAAKNGKFNARDEAGRSCKGQRRNSWKYAAGTLVIVPRGFLIN